MKKHLLITLLIMCCAVYSSMAQSFYTETFSGSLGTWSAIDHTGNGAWADLSNPFPDPSYGSVTFNSPTAANGFAGIVSDGVTSAINTDLVSSAINCSGQSYIALQFTQYFYLYSSCTAKVYVSTDSSSWTLIYDAVASSSQTDGELVNINISTYAANQPTVYIKYNYATTNDWWWIVDDISLVALPALDASVTSIISQPYLPIDSYQIQATIENMGGTTLNSLTMGVSANGTVYPPQTFTGLNLGTFQSATLQFTGKTSLTQVTNYNLKVYSSAPNGGNDANVANDTARAAVTMLSHQPDKHVLVEEFTTIPCGYCPGGLTRVEEITNSAITGPYTSVVSLHAGFYTDDMTTNDDNTLAAAFTDAAPTGNIDRVINPPGALYNSEPVAVAVNGMGSDSTGNNWKSGVEARHTVTPPVSISATNTYDSITRVVTVNVSSTFYGIISGDYRMNCYIEEDSVVGPSPDYDQHSYYYSSPTVDNPWLGIGYVITAGQVWGIAGYVQHHVERLLMDANGTWGTSGIIPANTTDGGTYTRTFTATLDTAWRSNFITLVPFVYQYNSNYVSGLNEIQNCISMPLNSTATIPASPIYLANVSPSTTNICSGGAAVLTVTTPGASYAWSNGATSASITVNPTSNTTYTVTVTNADNTTMAGSATVDIATVLHNSISASICTGSSYIFNGVPYTTSGSYIDTFSAVGGCDSIVTLQLNVASSLSGANSQTICLGTSYNGHSATGIYHDTLTAVGGCDSIITLNLTVLGANITSTQQSICQGQTVTFGGQTLSASGTYSDTLQATTGCDSVIQLALTVNALPTVNWSGNDTATFNSSGVALTNGTPAGGTYSGTGVYNNTFYPDSVSGPGTYTITYTVSNGSGCTNSTTGSVVVTVAGINDLNLENLITLYPNPSRDRLTIESSLFAISNNIAPEIYDITGKVVSTVPTTLQANKMVLNTSNLAAGMYSIRFNINGQQVNKKFVKMD